MSNFSSLRLNRICKVRIPFDPRIPTSSAAELLALASSSKLSQRAQPLTWEARRRWAIRGSAGYGRRRSTTPTDGRTVGNTSSWTLRLLTPVMLVAGRRCALPKRHRSAATFRRSANQLIIGWAQVSAAGPPPELSDRADRKSRFTELRLSMVPPVTLVRVRDNCGLYHYGQEITGGSACG